MMLYLLDTDILSLLQRRHAAIEKAIDQHSADRIGITSASVQEQVAGRLAMVSKAKSPADFALAAKSLSFTVTFLGRFPIYPETEASLARFEQLVRLKLNVGRMDLRIASIALELGATIVTRNHRDFARVPNLFDADWTT